MASLKRITAGLGLLAVLAALCCLVQPRWLASLGLDVWTLPDLLRQAREEEDRREQLEADVVRLNEDIRHKDGLVNDLIGRRVSLQEAVAGFRKHVEEMQPTAYRECRALHPGVSGDDLVRELLLDWVQVALDRDPERCLAVIARLQREGRGQPALY